MRIILIYDNIMKILVVTLGRTGSSNFCKQLQKDYGVSNLGEYFKPDIATVKDINLLLEKKSWICKIIPYHLVYLEEQLYQLDRLKKNNRATPLCERLILSKVAAKFNNDQELKDTIKYEDIEYRTRFLNLFRELVIGTDKIIYLYRDDFKQQVKSTCSASISGDFSRNRNVSEKIHIPDEMLSYISRDLLQQWMLVRLLYSEFPGEVVSTEKHLFLSKPYPEQDISCNEALIPELCIAKEIFKTNT